LVAKMNNTIEHTILAELTALRTELRDVRVAISGDPTDASKPGIMTRLDRLEVQLGAMQWFTRSMVAAAITVVVGAVLGMYIGKG